MAEAKINRVSISTKTIAEIMKKEGLGLALKNIEKIWYKNIKGVRKGSVTFDATDDEITEYMKCSLSVQYFAQKYCQIKREDGSIGPIKLRDYQKEIIDLYTKNRYSILMASRQTGKCSSFNVIVTVKISDEDIRTISLGELYYAMLKLERPLTFLENMKYILYKLYNRISQW
jgi:hypothetical protein